MSTPIDSHGTLIKRNGTTVGQLRDITPPALTRNTFDVSNQVDTDDVYVVGGIRRRGELQFGINFLQSGEVTHGQASGLLYSYMNKSNDSWTIAFPDNSTWVFSGFITNVGAKAPVEGDLGADISIRPTGSMVITPA